MEGEGWGAPRARQDVLAFTHKEALQAKSGAVLGESVAGQFRGKPDRDLGWGNPGLPLGLPVDTVKFPSVSKVK